MIFKANNLYKYEIFGINVTFLNYEEILDAIFNSSLRTFTCVNQYYLNLAYEDQHYKLNLNDFDLIHPDGIGIILAKKIIYQDSIKLKRVTGSDLYFKIFEKSYIENKTHFLLGDSQEVIDKAFKSIKTTYPQIKINGYHHGYIDLDDEKIIKIINDSNSFILMVGLGVKRQEYWVSKWKNKLNVKKIIVVGGGFRVISNDRLRGPLWVQKHGLEWFVRLLAEPKNNWERYLIGIPLFLIRVIKHRKIKNISSGIK